VIGQKPKKGFLVVQDHYQIKRKIGEHKIMPAETIEKIDIKEMEAANLIDIDRIVIGDVALRPAQRESKEYKALSNGIEVAGVLLPILVRPYDKDHTKVLLVDGLQRLSIVQDLYKKTQDPKYKKIAINLVTMDEMEMLSAQIQANVHRVETRLAACGQQIKRMMALNPLLTVTTIAHSLGHSNEWVTQRISLGTLRPEIAGLVDEGEIPALNAFALAKLSEEEQTAFVERAMTLEPKVFVDLANARAREENEAKREGRKGKAEEFISVKRLRKVNFIKAEYEGHEVRKALVTKNMSAADAFDLGVAWTLYQDPETYEQEKAEWTAKQEAKLAQAKEREEKREAEKVEKAKKLAIEAAVAADTAAALAAKA
jgi:hypothetical protein